MANYYEILQISPAAEQEVIAAAYKSLARKYHPDFDPTPKSAVRMKQLNEAYQTLSDPSKRRQYDFNLDRSTETPRRSAKARKEATPEGRNARQTNCHYCRCIVAKGYGYMQDVPSPRAKPMRRTVCGQCSGKAAAEWEYIAELRVRQKEIEENQRLGAIVVGSIVLCVILFIGIMSAVPK